MLAACAGIRPDSENRAVAKERRIDLDFGEPQTGTWQGRHVTVEYRYNIEGSRMTIEGRVLFPRRKLIDTFDLDLNVTDNTGVILRSELLASAPYRRMIQTLAFQRNLSLPEGADAMVFSYSGVSRGIGEGAGSPHRFWQSP
jgi:hypothetical protein